MQFRNSAGEKITVGQAAFAFCAQLVVGFVMMICLYWATVFAFCL
jgi:hypothetical protein